MMTADGKVKIGDFGTSADERKPGRNVPGVRFRKNEVMPRTIGLFGSKYFVAPEIVSCFYKCIG